MVYSTNPDFSYDLGDQSEDSNLQPGEQMLYVSLDSKRRKGKVVTLVEGFRGNTEELKTLEKLLKSKCGVGGTAKDGGIIIQGQLKQKVHDILAKEGFRVKMKG